MAQNKCAKCGRESKNVVELFSSSGPNIEGDYRYYPVGVFICYSRTACKERAKHLKSDEFAAEEYHGQMQSLTAQRNEIRDGRIIS